MVPHLKTFSQSHFLPHDARSTTLSNSAVKTKGISVVTLWDQSLIDGAAPTAAEFVSKY